MNTVTLRGVLARPLELNHTSHEENFYKLWVDVYRLSGKADCLRILASEEVIEGIELREGAGVEIEGQMRTYNNKSGEGGKLIISAFAREARLLEGEHVNNVYLSGQLCRTPIYRKTPLGREICDIMLAVPRAYGRADYLPLIAWGSAARAASLLEASHPLYVAGRFQSRGYVKVIDEKAIDMTAYEISVTRLFGSEEELLEQANT